MTNRNLKLIYFLAWLGVFLICILPLGTLGLRSLNHLEFFSLLFDPSVISTLRTSLGLGFASLFLGLGVALPLSYLLSRTNLPARKSLTIWLNFPFFLPSYLFAIAWIVLALPKVGLLTQLFPRLGLNIYSFTGLVWVTCNAFLPLLVSTLSKGFQSMDPSLEEAARICGASPWRTFLKVTLPCQLSGILGASLIFFFTILSSFGIPAIIGNPAKLFVLTTQIFTVSKMGGLKGADQGFVISLWLVAVGIILGLFSRFFRKRFQVSLISGKASRASLIELGQWRWPCFFFVSTWVLLWVFLPLGALFLSSFMKVSGVLSLENISLHNYAYVFRLNEGKMALLNSLTLAFLGALTCCGLGFLVAYFYQRSQLKGASSLERISGIPFSIPGTVLGLAFIVSYGTGWGFDQISLLGTPFLLYFAYVAKDLAIAVHNLIPALGQIDRSLDEAGRICGADELGVLDRLLFPLSTPALKTVFFLCALPMLTELTMSVLLFGPGTETLGTLIFQLQDYSNPQAACALASMVVLVLGLGVLISKQTNLSTS